MLSLSETGPLTVTASASGSTDTPQAPIVQIFFDFGDGSAKVLADANGQATHTYAASGPYTVSVVVIDKFDYSDSTSAQINVT